MLNQVNVAFTNISVLKKLYIKLLLNLFILFACCNLSKSYFGFKS